MSACQHSSAMVFGDVCSYETSGCCDHCDLFILSCATSPVHSLDLRLLRSDKIDMAYGIYGQFQKGSLVKAHKQYTVTGDMYFRGVHAKGGRHSHLSSSDGTKMD